MLYIKQGILFCFFAALVSSCGETETPYFKISGPTMGTTYHITLQTNSPESIQKSVDSILADFNLSMSSYIDSSTLSYFNAADSFFCFDPARDPYFEPIFKKSKEVFEKQVVHSILLLQRW